LSPLSFVYDENDALFLWKDFLEEKAFKQVVPPMFIKILKNEDEQESL
jgi:hypothetical protein